MAKVMIDPGHGGTDPGASGNGLIEKQWVLEVSLELAKILRRLGHVVKLTRSDDRFIGLSQRAVEANRWGADIFISIHFNAGGGADAKGWEDFRFSLTSNPATALLQNDIHDAVKPILAKHNLRNRGKKSANFAVLRETRMPAILIEGGFVDSSDHAILRKASYKKDVAIGVANGVQNYFGLRPVQDFGWIKNSVGWWYRRSNGGYPKAQWQKINNTWYYFDSKGYMMTGWQKIKNKWYYLNMSGAMQTGWRKSAGKWYYLNPGGAMQTGLITVNGKHYYLNASGAMLENGKVTLEANKHGHLK